MPQVSAEFTVSNRSRPLVVPSTFEKGTTGKFKLTLLTQDPTAKLVKATAEKDIIVKKNGAWKKGSTAGGRRKFGTWVNNPQFKITGAAGTSVQVVLLQRQPRAATVHIVKNSDEFAGKEKVFPGYEVLAEMKEPGEESIYFARPELSVGIVLENADPLFAVPSCYTPQDENAFELLVISDQPVQVDECEAGPGADVPSFEGGWFKGQSDGGPLNCGTFRMNPQFRLTNTTGSPQQAMLNLIRTSGDAAIGLAVVANSAGGADRKYFEDKCVLPGYKAIATYQKDQGGKKFKYVKADNVQLQVTVPANSVAYAVPSCAKRGQLSNFKLTVMANEGLKAVQATSTIKPVTFRDRLPNGHSDADEELKNPSYRLKVNKPTKLCCMFRREDDKEYAFALSLVQNKDPKDSDRILKGFKTVAEISEEVDGETTEWIPDEEEGCFTTTVQAGTYFLVPRMTAFDEEEELDVGEYQITVMSDNPTLEAQKIAAK